MANRLIDIVRRAENWPPAARDQLADVADAIERGLTEGLYRATPEELAAIDEARAECERGAVASDEEVEQAFAVLPRS
ncbi:MAG: hypothetical protein U1E56_00880 [Bauldia sp.]